jgi:hypothetical protein
MADNKPLWRVMAKAPPPGAIFGTPGVVERRIAAELRAIAEEIRKRDPNYILSALAIEQWLRAEADRAEAGDQA